MCFASLSYSNVIIDQNVNDSYVSARYVNKSRMKIEWHNYRNFADDTFVSYMFRDFMQEVVRIRCE